MSEALPEPVSGLSERDAAILDFARASMNYGLSRSWVFRSGRAHREALPRFLAVAAMGLGGTALLMACVLAITDQQNAGRGKGNDVFHSQEDTSVE